MERIGMPLRYWIGMGVIAAFLSAIAPTAQAQIWDGGGSDALWGTANNWNGNAVPINNAHVQFGSAFTSGNPTLDADRSTGRFNFTANQQVTLNTNNAANDLTLDATAGFNNADGTLRVQNSDFTHVINTNIILRGNPNTSIFWSGDNDAPGFRWNSGVRPTVSVMARDTSGNATSHTLTSGNSISIGTVPFLFDWTSMPAVQPSDGTVNFRLPSNARLRFNDVNQISGNITMEGGVIQWTGAGDFTMSRGPGIGQWEAASGLAGWSAFGADRSVNIGGAGATLTTNFRLILGSGDATHTLTMKNPLTRTGDFSLQTVNGPAAVEGKLQGPITLGAGQDCNFIGNGTVELAVANSITAGRVNVSGGTVLVDTPAALGSTGLVFMTNGSSLPAAVSGDAFLLTNGAMTIPNPITLSSVVPVRATIGGNTADSSTFSGNITMGISAAKDLTVSAASGGTVTFSGILNEPGSLVSNLTKRGNGRVILSNASNAYNGSTTVEQGTLIVNGSIASSSGVTVNAGATLGGHGTVSTITGAGTVTPGNSPGILSATSLDPSGGADFIFEFTQFGSPTWGSPSASGNDVLRLTGVTPFLSSLTSANVVDVIFAVPGNDADDLVGQTFRGGFFTEEDGDFLAMVNGATFRYLAPSFLSPVDVTLSTVAENGGRVLQFTVNVVPEPSIAMLGMMIVGGLALRRRK